MTRDLAATMAALYASEINCGLQSFWDGGFNVWLGDDMNGWIRQENFDGPDIGEAAAWLHEQAIEAYPDSEYAKAASVAA